MMKPLSFLIPGILIFAACNSNKNNSADNNITEQDTVVKDSEIRTTPDSIQANTTSIDTSEEESDPLIIPGESVGKITLGMDAADIETILGKPDMSNAAMGKAWITWRGKKTDEHNNKTALDIYTAYKDTSMREHSVQQIRTTSSFFKTENSVHVYSSLDDIKTAFPGIKKTSQYKSDNRIVFVYDDESNGIAFEITSANEQSICIGIIIHQKEKSVNDIYIMLHPDMKRFKK